MSEINSFLRISAFSLVLLTGFLFAPSFLALAQEENAELDSTEVESVEPEAETPATTPSAPEAASPVVEAPVEATPAAAAPVEVEAATVEAAAPTPVVPAPAAAPAEPAKAETSLESSAPRKTMFGTYRIRMSVNKPTFNEDLKFYDDLYGSPKNYGMFGVDWFAWDWYVTLGLGLRSGFYAANGERVKGGSVNKQNPDSGAFEKTGKTSLTMIPLQTVLTMQFSPFQRKWLVIDGWFGAEYAYWQEVRIEETTTTTKSAIFAATAAASDDGSLTNKGWAKATVMGVAANILLNPLDDRSTKSMEATMGLGFVYLTPFVEVVTGVNGSGVNWGRKVMGLGFTFESIK